MYIGGLDIGTAGCKVTVYDDTGQFLLKVYQPYQASRTASEHEIDTETIWLAVKAVLREASAKYRIAGIGVTSFGETFTALDENNRPVFPSMLYTDPRGRAECDALRQQLGDEKITAITGLKPHEMYSISKAVWLKQNRPELFARVRRIFLIQDYIVYMLTGKRQIDFSLASRTMAFDINRLCWSSEILDAAGIPAELLPQPVPTGTSAGKCKPEIADELNLSPDMIAVSVSHDQIAAAIGAGIFEPDVAVDGSGTVECVTPMFRSVPQDKAFTENGYTAVPYILESSYVCYAFTFTGGALLKWFIDTMAKEEKAEAKRRDISVYRMLDKTIPDAPTGILVLPHFAGAATPYMDSAAKGVIAGVTVADSISDLYKAVMEGVAYEMRVNFEALGKSGVTYRRLRASGGGANSSVWLQIKADILGIPVTALASNETGSVGSAMLTGIATGVFENLEDAAAKMVREAETYYPDEEKHRIYNRYFESYRQLYTAVRPLFGGVQYGHK